MFVSVACHAGGSSTLEDRFDKNSFNVAKIVSLKYGTKIKIKEGFYSSCKGYITRSNAKGATYNVTMFCPVGTGSTIDEVQLVASPDTFEVVK